MQQLIIVVMCAIGVIDVMTCLAAWKHMCHPIWNKLVHSAISVTKPITQKVHCETICVYIQGSGRTRVISATSASLHPVSLASIWDGTIKTFATPAIFVGKCFLRRTLYVFTWEFTRKNRRHRNRPNHRKCGIARNAMLVSPEEMIWEYTTRISTRFKELPPQRALQPQKRVPPQKILLHQVSVVFTLDNLNCHRIF